MGRNVRTNVTVGNYISKIKSEGLSYKEGAKRFVLKVSDIYEYNKRFNKISFECWCGMVRNWTKIGNAAIRGHVKILQMEKCPLSLPVLSLAIKKTGVKTEKK